MTAHRWSVDTPDRLGTQGLWAAAQARARELDRDILAVAALVALTGFAVVLRVGAAAAPVQAGEGRGVAQTYGVDALGTLLDPSASPLAWLQTGGYTALTDAFVRHSTAVGAAREPMIVVSAATSVLLWVLARRIGLSRLTAAAAIATIAVSPMALGLQLGTRPENVAVPWALAGVAVLWTPHRHRRLYSDLWATAFLVIAVITAPMAFPLIITAAWLVWRRGRRRLSLMLSSLFVLGTGIGMGVSTALIGLQIATEGPSATDWFAQDTVFAVAAVGAAVLTLFSYRLRPLAAGVLALFALAAVPGGPDTAALAVAVAPAALLVAGAVERATRFQPREWTWHKPLRVPTALLAATMAAATLPTWIDGLRAPSTDPTPIADAAHWLTENLPTTPVVTDGTTWVDLLRDGRPPTATTRAMDCAATCVSQSWLLVTPALRLVFAHRPTLTTAAATAETVAIFGTGDTRVEIHRPTTDGEAEADEHQARVQAGTRIATSPHIAAPTAVTETLRAGRTDPRLLTTLSTLAATQPIRVTALPPIPGEDAANQPRRQAVLTTP
uniref:hypothetical protein n=1 Tax=Actinokineospora inagensis TaxID=103730 RepID=UPI00047CFA19